VWRWTHELQRHIRDRLTGGLHDGGSIWPGSVATILGEGDQRGREGEWFQTGIRPPAHRIGAPRALPASQEPCQPRPGPKLTPVQANLCFSADQSVEHSALAVRRSWTDRGKRTRWNRGGTRLKKSSSPSSVRTYNVAGDENAHPPNDAWAAQKSFRKALDRTTLRQQRIVSREHAGKMLPLRRAAQLRANTFEKFLSNRGLVEKFGRTKVTDDRRAKRKGR